MEEGGGEGSYGVDAAHAHQAEAVFQNPCDSISRLRSKTENKQDCLENFTETVPYK